MTPTLRPPAVAGLFYPALADALRKDIAVALADSGVKNAPVQTPRALIVPHAGYAYSARVAAAAYAQLRAHRYRIHRVILIGPSHRVPFDGMALSLAEHWQTPLGNIAIDQAGNARLAILPGVQALEAAHEREHSLEVQLPFLQTVLDNFTLLPIVLGRVSPEQVATVLDMLWDDETLVVVSSDLSHYLDDDTAQRLDAVTCQAIEDLADDMIGDDQACGRTGIKALLITARRHGLTPVTLRLCNSSDTTGDHTRVVGYGAWAFYQRTQKVA